MFNFWLCTVDPPYAPLKDRMVSNVTLEGNMTEQKDSHFTVTLTWNPPVYPYKIPHYYFVKWSEEKNLVQNGASVSQLLFLFLFLFFLLIISLYIWRLAKLSSPRHFHCTCNYISSSCYVPVPEVWSALKVQLWQNSHLSMLAGKKEKHKNNWIAITFLGKKIMFSFQRYSSVFYISTNLNSRWLLLFNFYKMYSKLKYVTTTFCATTVNHFEENVTCKG